MAIDRRKNEAPGEATAREFAEMEALKKRHADLATKKTVAETNLANARQQLEKLQAEARAGYGTDDVAKLRQQLAAIKAENAAKTEQYRQHIEKIEGDLKAVESQHGLAGEVGDGR